MEKLKSRECEIDSSIKAVYIFPQNKEVDERNESEYNKLSSELEIIKNASDVVMKRVDGHWNTTTDVSVTEAREETERHDS